MNAANIHPILSNIANGPLWVPIYYILVVLAFSLVTGFFLSVMPKSMDKVDATLQWFPVVVIIVTGEFFFLDMNSQIYILLQKDKIPEPKRISVSK